MAARSWQTRHHEAVRMVRAVGQVVITCGLFLAVASGCGENGGQVSSSTSSTSSSTTEARCHEVPIVVIAQDIPAGTTGAEAAANGMLREDAIAPTYRPATAVSSVDQIADGVAVADLAANQVVTFEHFGLSTDTTLTPSGTSCATSGPTTTAGG
jgi:hypothetical protein